MQFADTVITRFEADISQLSAALARIANAFNTFPQKVQDAASPRTRRNYNQLSSSISSVSEKASTLSANARNLNDLMKKLSEQVGTASSSFRRAAMAIQTGSDRLDILSLRLDRASMMMWKFTMAGISLRELSMITGASAVAIGLGVRKMIDSFTKIDVVQKQFKAIYGIKDISQDVVQYLIEASTRIRYSLDEVMEAGRVLAVEGFNPKELIMLMADLAAGVNQEGVNIVSAARAFVDATNGEFRRLKQTFQVTREDVEKLVPEAFGPRGEIVDSAKATEGIIMAIREKYEGMNEATMKTITGQASNLEDALTKALAPFGEKLAPTISGILNKIMKFLNLIERLGKGPLGGVIAQFALWSTIILALISGVSILATGLITLIGVFASIKVFVATRQKSLMDIMKAEVKLLAITRELAALEAQRHMQNIDALREEIALTSALAELREYEARGEVVPPEVMEKYRRASAAVEARQKQEELNALMQKRKQAEREIEARRALVGIPGGEEALREAEAHLEEINNRINELQTAYKDISAAAQGVFGLERINELEGVVNEVEKLRNVANEYKDVVATTGRLEERRTREIEAAHADPRFEGAALEARVEAISERYDNLIQKAREKYSRVLVERYGEDVVSEMHFILNEAGGNIDDVITSLNNRLWTAHRNRLFLIKQGIDDVTNAIKAAENRIESLQGIKARGRERRQIEQQIEAENRRLVTLNEQLNILRQQLAVYEEMTRNATEAAAMAQAEAEAQQTAAAAAEANAAAQQASAVAAEAEAAAETVTTAQQTAQTAATAGQTFMRGFTATLEALWTIARGLLGIFTALIDAIIGVVGSFMALLGAITALILVVGVLYVGWRLFVKPMKDAAIAMEKLAKRTEELVDVFTSAIEQLQGMSPMHEDLAKQTKEYIDILNKYAQDIKWTTVFTNPIEWALRNRELTPAQRRIFAVFIMEDYEKRLEELSQEHIDYLVKYNKMSREAAQKEVEARMQRYREEREKILQGKSISEASYEQLKALEELIERTAYESFSRFGPTGEIEPGEILPRGRRRETLLAFGEKRYEKLQMLPGAEELAKADAAAEKFYHTLRKLVESREFKEIENKFGLTRQEAEMLVEALAAAEHKSITLNKYFEDMWEQGKKLSEEFEGISEFTEEKIKEGYEEKQIAEMLGEKLEEMQKNYYRLLKINNEYNKINTKNVAEREKELEKMRKQLDLIKKYKEVVEAIFTIRKIEGLRGITEAVGLNSAYIWGPAVANAERLLAEVAKTPEERLEHITNAYKALSDYYRAAEEIETEPIISPIASGYEKAAALRKAAAKEIEYSLIRQRDLHDEIINEIEKEADIADKEGNEARAAYFREAANRARELADRDKALAKNRALQKNIDAMNSEIEEITGALNNQLALYELQGKKSWEMLDIEKQIAMWKYYQLISQGKINDAYNVWIGYLSKEKAANRERLQDTERNLEAYLGYVEALRDAGYISEDAVTSARMRLSNFYRWMASQYEIGSTEWYEYMTKSLSELRRETQDEFESLIGEIVGAPAEAINRIISEGELYRFWEAGVDMASRNLRAELINRTDKELIVRVNFEGAMETVESKIKQVMPQVIAQFAQMLLSAINK